MAHIERERDDTRTDTASELGEASELEEILHNIGVVSPITKSSAGKMYYEQVARQIADLLFHENRIMRLGGMITLTDLYCVYNRARGTELISPDDLLNATKLFIQLKIGLSLRQFQSGVCVVQADNFDDETFCKRLLDLAENFEESGGANTGWSALNAVAAAQNLNISLTIAKEQLCVAEEREYLCRDDSWSGVFFYPNKFVDFEKSLEEKLRTLSTDN